MEILLRQIWSVDFYYCSLLVKGTCNFTAPIYLEDFSRDLDVKALVLKKGVLGEKFEVFMEISVTSL